MFTRIQLTYAGNISGWMTYKELKWLAKQAKKHSKIVEIGSYMGRSTRALADNTNGVVYAVDDFKGPRDMNLPSSIRDNLFEIFINSTGDLIQLGKIIPVAISHENIQVEKPDMVFLDGSHEYPDVKRDIKLWLEQLAPGGLICGHDYTNIYDVRQAVDESFGRVKLARGTSIWYVKT